MSDTEIVEDFDSDEYSDEEMELDQLMEKTQPKQLSSIEARRRIEMLRERMQLKEMESDPLMDTLILEY